MRKNLLRAQWELFYLLQRTVVKAKPHQNQNLTLSPQTKKRRKYDGRGLNG